VAKALASADAFAALIRDHFGTRGALHAAISGDSAALRKRHEETARYNIYNGMRHLMGVEGETWLTSMIFRPTPDGRAMTTMTVHGILGMRRLRPDTPVRFSFGPPHREPGVDGDPMAGAIDLSDFYLNEAAPLESEVRDGRVIHQLASTRVGKDAILDMLAVSRDDRGIPRYASPNRHLAGVAIFTDVPVRTLIGDLILHESLVPPTLPELMVYNPGARGPANPNDPSRQTDRVEVPEGIEPIQGTPTRCEAPGIPNYGAMLRRVFEDLGDRPGAYRVFRTEVVYPVQGFQYVIAFSVPDDPTSSPA
ncbi:MAG: hypothetical protein KDA28_00315, partial [Phycisphaerales bacterium]|nr:hypothetical protein [Phycisphaerales bacterium]